MELPSELIKSNVDATAEGLNDENEDATA